LFGRSLAKFLEVLAHKLIESLLGGLQLELGADHLAFRPIEITLRDHALPLGLNTGGIEGFDRVYASRADNGECE
jgi:hypothetical protein